MTREEVDILGESPAQPGILKIRSAERRRSHDFAPRVIWLTSRTAPLAALVVIAALLIVCVLIMMVLTKTREIAILRAMGASRWGVMRVFVLEGMLIGLVGSVGGTVPAAGTRKRSSRRVISSKRGSLCETPRACRLREG